MVKVSGLVAQADSIALFDGMLPPFETDKAQQHSISLSLRCSIMNALQSHRFSCFICNALFTHSNQLSHTSQHAKNMFWAQ
jgi:hypothetical protein